MFCRYPCDQCIKLPIVWGSLRLAPIKKKVEEYTELVNSTVTVGSIGCIIHTLISLSEEYISTSTSDHVFLPVLQLKSILV